jgi:hypothetical protein
MTITAEEFAALDATLAEHGVTPFDLADALHRQRLADPDFDPVEEARDQIRAACSNLIDALAYLHGGRRQAIFDHLTRITDKTLTGDELLLDTLDTLNVWTEQRLSEATGKATEE